MSTLSEWWLLRQVECDSTQPNAHCCPARPSRQVHVPPDTCNRRAAHRSGGTTFLCLQMACSPEDNSILPSANTGFND